MTDSELKPHSMNRNSESQPGETNVTASASPVIQLAMRTNKGRTQKDVKRYHM